MSATIKSLQEANSQLSIKAN